jgi:outer membrane protein TolC
MRRPALSGRGKVGVALALAFAGCALGARAQAQPVPAAPASAARAAKPASGREPGLGDVLRVIGAHAPDLLAARAAWQQASAEEQQARAAWFGKVDAYALSQHDNDPRLTRPITLPPNVANYPFSADQFGYGVNASLPIDLSGQIAAGVDAARAHLRGARWSADDVRLRCLLQGADLYRNLQALAGRQQALQQQLHALQASARSAAAGLVAGTISRVNRLRVDAAVAAAQAQLAGLDGQQRKLRAELAAQMGRPSFDAGVAPPATGPSRLPRNPDLDPPAIRAAQSALRASEERIRVAQRAMLPQFAVTAGWNRNAVHWDTQPVDTWQVNVGMTFNLWSGGAQRSAVDAAQAAARAAAQRLEAAQDRLRAARDGAAAIWSAQQQAWRAARAGLDAAALGARIEQDRFDHGLGSATELIDAEAALAAARAGVASALAAWWQSDDALRYAYGEAPDAMHDDGTPASDLQP